MTLPFVFEVPAEFTPLDLTAYPAQRALRTTRRLAEVLPESTEEQRAAITAAQETLIEQLREHGVRYAATVLEPARPTAGLFAVRLQEVETPDPLTPLAAALRPRAEVHELDTHLGRVVAAAYEQQGVRQMEIFLPVSDQDAVAAFSIATEHVVEWETYTRHLAAVFRTVQLT